MSITFEPKYMTETQVLVQREAGLHYMLGLYDGAGVEFPPAGNDDLKRAITDRYLAQVSGNMGRAHEDDEYVRGMSQLENNLYRTIERLKGQAGIPLREVV